MQDSDVVPLLDMSSEREVGRAIQRCLGNGAESGDVDFEVMIQTLQLNVLQEAVLTEL